MPVAGASSSRGRPADQRSPWDADADHPSEAPLHLKPFADVVRRYGGLCLYGRAGYEADDMIASLAAGLLVGYPYIAASMFVGPLPEC